MKKNLTTKIILTAAMAIATTFTACNPTNTQFDDEDMAAVAEQFVDHTVAPTYTLLAQKAETLASMLATLRQSPTDAGIEDACNVFLQAREQWERSEAFLFGVAGDYGVDPHIDSWPLDENQFNTLMGNDAMLKLLDSEDGDVVAGESLGNALLGFHGLEYILFKDGKAKKKADITENEWIYVVAVAGDLRNRCYQLEAGWLGDKAPATHLQKLEDIEMGYTVAGGDYSYGDNMKNAGKAGSTYVSRTAALIAIVQGCADIADEVGSSKINSAYALGDETYIESPYSHMSIADFKNNIISIQNVYFGGVENERDESKSLHAYVKNMDESLDAKVIDAINTTIAKIEAMPAPFVTNFKDSKNGEAVEACAHLEETLSEIIDAINNN